MVVFVAGLWTSPAGILGGQGLVDWTLYYVFELQLWVLLVIPLGVLAASDAARTGRRGWLALFIVLIILAPVAPWINSLINNIQVLLAGPCFLNGACSSGGAPWLVTQVGWGVAFLPVPIAALVYSFMSARSAAGPAATEAGQGERRALIVCALVAIAVMSALGYLGISGFLIYQFGSRAQRLVGVSLQGEALTIGLMLAALPVAIASMAMAHAAQTSRPGWLAGWIALIPLALLTADLGSLWGWSLIAALNGAQTSDQIPYFQQLRVVSIVAPVVIMLVALIYALTVMRPRSRAAALAVA